jgi:hypothetical protein
VIHKGKLSILLGLAAALVAACGSDKAPSGGSTPSASAGSTSATASASASATASSSAAGGQPAADRVNALKGALLTAAEVGTGFKQSPGQDEAEPGPCEKEPMQTRFPDNKQLGASFSKGDDNTGSFATVDEIVVVFPTPERAKAAYEWNKGELNCGRGTVDEGGSKLAFTVGKPIDVTPTVGGEQAILWNITFDANKTVQLSFLAVRFADTVVDFGFTAGPSATGLRKVADIVKAGVDKLQKA